MKKNILIFLASNASQLPYSVQRYMYERYFINENDGIIDMYSFMASAHAGMKKKLTENETFLMIYDDIPLLVAVNVQ